MLHIKKNGVDIPLTKLVSTSADEISYNNTESGLSATNTQDAIDEVVEDVETLGTSKQPKTLSSPITVAGESKTTVEGALGGINDFTEDNISAIVNVYGSKQLIPFPYETASGTINNGCTWTYDKDGVLAVSGTVDANGYTLIQLVKNSHSLYETLKRCPCVASIDSSEPVACRVSYADSSFNLLGYQDIVDDDVILLPPAGTYYVEVYLLVFKDANTSINITNIKPMIRDARITDPTWVPYAKTNRELTESFTKNNIEAANRVDLSPYNTLDNWYEIPDDGYVVLNAVETLSGVSSLTIYGQNRYTTTNFTLTLANPTVSFQGTAIFVKKGMHVVCAVLQTGHMASYLPLT